MENRLLLYRRLLLVLLSFLKGANFAENQFRCPARLGGAVRSSSKMKIKTRGVGDDYRGPY